MFQWAPSSALLLPVHSIWRGQGAGPKSNRSITCKVGFPHSHRQQTAEPFRPRGALGSRVSPNPPNFCQLCAASFAVQLVICLAASPVRFYSGCTANTSAATWKTHTVIPGVVMNTQECQCNEVAYYISTHYCIKLCYCT